VIAGDIFTDEPYGIAVKKGEAELLQAVNDFLKEYNASGEYDKLYEKWLGEKPKK
jgi:putative glutamine transport system substrate-binding protein